MTKKAEKKIIESKFQRDKQDTYTEVGDKICFQYVTGGESVRTYLGKIKPDGSPSDDKVQIPTTIGSLRVPRECTVWGTEEVKDGKLTGDIKIMPYGAEGGVPVLMRYIERCPKLSYKWQEQNGFDKQIKDPSIDIQEKTLIELSTSTDKQLIYFFLNCSYNGDNPNRMPDADILIRDYDERKPLEFATKRLEEAQVAIGKYNIIMRNETKLEQIAASLGLDVSNKVIYKQLLLRKVTEAPEEFIKAYEDSINNILVSINTAIARNVLEVKETEIVLSPLENNGTTEKVPVTFDVSKCEHDEAIEMLMDYYNSDAGEKDYTKLLEENKKREALYS